jgi:hypothetical protein
MRKIRRLATKFGPSENLVTEKMTPFFQQFTLQNNREKLREPVDTYILFRLYKCFGEKQIYKKVWPSFETSGNTSAPNFLCTTDFFVPFVFCGLNFGSLATLPYRLLSVMHIALN